MAFKLEHHIPSYCLICKSSPDCDNTSANGGSADLWGKSSPSMLTDHLQVIFILRNVLKIPKEEVCSYLQRWGSPEKWIWICRECDNGIIRDARKLYEAIVKAAEEFKRMQKMITDKIKSSSGNQVLGEGRHNVTNAIYSFVNAREYRFNAGDPFLEGDKRALYLAKRMETNSTLEDNNLLPEGDKVEEFAELDSTKILQGVKNMMQMLSSQVNKVEEDAEECEMDSKNDDEEAVASDVESESGWSECGDDVEVLSNPSSNASNCDSEVMEKESDPVILDLSSKDEQGQHVALKKKNPSGRKNPLKCPKCLRIFHNQIAYDVHLQVHQAVEGNKSAFRCNINGCGRVFQYEMDVEKHQRKCHHLQVAVNRPLWEERKAKLCSACDLAFPAEYFQKHLQLHHGGDQDKQDIKPVPVKPVASTSSSSALVCPICKHPTRCTKEHSLQTHLDRHKTSSFHCFVCLSLRKNSRGLRQHIARRHREVVANDPEIKRAVTIKQAEYRNNEVCPFCTEFHFEARKKERLCEHLETCQGKPAGVIYCPLCSEYKSASPNKSDFNDHLRNKCLGKEILPENTISLTNRIFSCNLCQPGNFKFGSDKYFRLDAFLKHYLGHYKRQYKCTQCSKLVSELGQSVHWTTTHKELASVPILDRFTKELPTLPQVNWWCSVCNERFNDEDSWDSHLENLHKNKEPRQFSCKSCQKSYFSEDELKLHEGSVHVEQLNVRVEKPKEWHLCEACPKKFNRRFKLKVHIQQAHERPKPYKCDQCGEAFSIEGRLKNHKNREHTHYDIECDICHKKFPEQKSLKIHVLMAHNTRFRFNCHLCSKGFRIKYHLTRHLAKDHGIGEILRFSCKVEGCDKKFADEMKLKEHEALHRPAHERPLYECKFCDEKFTSRLKRQTHQNQHLKDGLRPFQCELCGKDYNAQQHLDAHMEWHETQNMEELEPRFECRHCGRKFHDSGSWEQHELSHLPPEQRPRPYVCESCGKAFLTPSHLNAHVKRHVAYAEGPTHQCSFCDKKFAFLKSLQKHEELHRNAETKPYKCPVCEKGFSRKDYIYGHLKTHKNEKS